MDGRDIGTVVMPNADVKIFLTAAPEERAKRRYDELVQKGENVKFEDVLADLNKRDYNDSHREHAPLKQAEDAILVDTTGNTFEQSVEQMLKTIEGAKKL
jgi:cytidylate kinase